MMEVLDPIVFTGADSEKFRLNSRAQLLTNFDSIQFVSSSAQTVLCTILVIPANRFTTVVVAFLYVEESKVLLVITSDIDDDDDDDEHDDEHVHLWVVLPALWQGENACGAGAYTE
eukprot:4740659-Amphidinium_carterae.1